MCQAILLVLLLWTAAALPAQAEFACAGQPSALPAGVSAKTTGSYGNRVPTHGRAEVLVIYAAFADESASPPPDWAATVLDVDRVGSLSHFYRAMSFGELTVGGTVLPRRYRSNDPPATYVATEAGEMGDFGRFSVEVFTRVDRDVDLRRYDNDGPDGWPDSGDDDGFVDYVFINLKNIPYGFLVGRATGIGGLGLDYVSNDVGRDGIPIRVRGGIGYGAIQQENGFHLTAAVMAHEFGHGLGLPDLYDLYYSDPSEDSAGIGRWGLMGWGALGWNGSDGPNPLSAWSLERLGWVSVDNGRLLKVTGDTTSVRLEPVRAGGAVVRLPLGGSEGAEYLLIEERSRSSGYYDRALPAEGLLVWRVRADQRGNNSEHEKLVDLVCADGLYRDAGFPLGKRPDGRFGGDNLDFWSHDEAYRRSRGGNMGDATDPFGSDGVTRLHMGGNPSTLPPGSVSSGFTSLEMTMRRQGSEISVDVALPRWAGTISEEILWTGQVWIDGDLRVAPEGRLSIAEGTHVRIAGRDRLHQGLDPERVEFLVNGDLKLIAGRNGARRRVVFEPMSPGVPWYGILLEPAPLSLIELRTSEVEVVGATHGISFPRAPVGMVGQTLAALRLIDVSGPKTAGNGDGELSPGETFQVALDLANWTLERYDQPRGALRWLASNVVSEGGSPSRRVDLEFPVIYPGVERTLTWPSLTLSPDAQEGEEIAFSILVQGFGSEVYQESISFVVRGRYPAHSARLEVIDRPMHEGLVVVPQGKTSTIEATIEGQVTFAELVARPIDDDLPVLELPMTHTTGSVFRVDFEPIGTGAYELFLRVRGTDGAVAFSDARLDLWVLAGDKLPALAFLGPEYGSNKVERIRAVLQDQVEVFGLDLHLIHLLSPPRQDYRRLLSYYGEQKGIVIWAADLGTAGADAGLRELLEKGGRLLLAANVRNSSNRIGAFLESMLLTGIGGRSTGAGRVDALFPLPSFTLQVQHSWLTPVPPSEPILVDYQSRAVGLRLDMGTYRALFLAFDLRFASHRVLEDLLGPALLFLEEHTVREAYLEIVDKTMAYQSALSAPAEPVVLRARIGGAVSRAEVVLTRGAPDFGARVGVLALRHTGAVGEAQEFQGTFQPPEPGRYRLALRSYDAENNIVVTAAQLNLLVHDTEPALLVLRDNPHLTTARALTEGVSVLNLEPGDWQVLPLLLERYLDAGDAVAYLVGTPTYRILDALGQFATHGGHLLVSSGSLRETPEGEAFLRDVVGVGKTSRAKQGQLHTRGLAPGGDLSMGLFFAPFEQLLAPSVPLARTDAGEIVAVSRRADGQRVVYLPFSASLLKGYEGERFARVALSALRDDAPADAGFAVAGHEIEGHKVLLPADRATPIQARVRGDVDGVDLFVQAYGDPTDVSRLPMRHRGGDLFEVDFPPPGVGHYLLFLQLRTTSADTYPSNSTTNFQATVPSQQTFLASTSLRVDALTFGEFKPVLLLIGEKWPAAVREEVITDVVEVLNDRGLDANVVVVPESGPLFDAFLDNYLDPGEMVIWMGQLLMEDAQEAFRRYLASGGRLLMASAEFRYSPGGPRFLRDWLGVDEIGMGFPTRGQRFFSGDDPDNPFDARLAYAKLQVNRVGEVVFSDEKGGVAGVRVSGPYRSLFLSFEMHKFASPQRRRLLDELFGFLASQEGESPPISSPDAGAPDLRLMPEPLVDGPVATRDLAPVVVVRNDGDGDAELFRAGYQIVLGDSVVATGDQAEVLLAAGETRTVTLPVWGEAVAGDYRIRFGTSLHADSALIYDPAQRLHVADPPAPFTTIYVPGSMSLGNGATLFDYDGDGDLDPYLVRRGAPDRLLRNDGGFFVAAAAEAGLDIDGNGRAVAIGDADGDGDLDVYLVTEAANHWFVNNGDGTFTDLTHDPLTDANAGRSAAFLDVDRDGDLDLYVVNADGANRLFVQEVAGFVDRAPQLGLADEGSGRGVAVADVDGDGDADLFLANSTGGSHLLRNDGNRFTAVEAAAGLDLSGGEVGVAFGDYNGDGYVDLFVGEERGANRLFANQGDGTFVDAARRDTLDLGKGAVGAAFLDVDNDGDLDLMTTAVNAGAGGDQLFLGRAPFLLPIGDWLGLKQASAGRGLSVGDIDGDGSMDVFVADARRSRLYRNPLGQARWLGVRLLGLGGNRWGLGSRVEVWVDGRRSVRQLYSALGYGSQSHPTLHFGLGEAVQADRVLVTWPDGERSGYTNAPAGKLLLLSQPDRSTAVGELTASVPETLRLDPGYPNPFNASTTVAYALPTAGPTRLLLYGVNGQRVRRLVDEHKVAGVYRARWDGTDDEGRRVASGVYFLLLEARGQRRAGRLMLIE